MKLVTYSFDENGMGLVKHEVDISGHSLQVVKNGVKSAMRTAVFKNKLERFKTNHPDVNCNDENLPNVIAHYPELASFESWEIDAINNYVDDMFK